MPTVSWSSVGLSGEPQLKSSNDQNGKMCLSMRYENIFRECCTECDKTEVLNIKKRPRFFFTTLEMCLEPSLKPKV